MKKQRMNGYLHLGLILTCALAALIILGFFWTPYDPQAMSVGPKFDTPSLRHLMGTDNFGRDIFSRVLQGAGTTFAIAVSTVAIGAVLGTLDGPVYSHVVKSNLPSLALHERLGFRRIQERALYLDGSLDHRACTLRWGREG